jgi:hypothetical protein
VVRVVWSIVQFGPDVPDYSNLDIYQISITRVADVVGLSIHISTAVITDRGGASKAPFTNPCFSSEQWWLWSRSGNAALASFSISSKRGTSRDDAKSRGISQMFSWGSDHNILVSRYMGILTLRLPSQSLQKG